MDIALVHIFPTGKVHELHELSMFAGYEPLVDSPLTDTCFPGGSYGGQIS